MNFNLTVSAICFYQTAVDIVNRARRFYQEVETDRALLSSIVRQTRRWMPRDRRSKLSILDKILKVRLILL